MKRPVGWVTFWTWKSGVQATLVFSFFGFLISVTLPSVSYVNVETRYSGAVTVVRRVERL